MVVLLCSLFTSSDSYGGRNFSEFELANIEALANEEPFQGEPCYSSGTWNSDKPKVVVCGTPCHLEPMSLGIFPSISYCQ
jgi:hypothetical protein